MPSKKTSTILWSNKGDGRKTMSRVEMMEYVAEQTDAVKGEIHKFVEQMDGRYANIVREKDAMAKMNEAFKSKIRNSTDEFIKVTTKDLRHRAFEVQDELKDRINSAESSVVEFYDDLEILKKDMNELTTQVNGEYMEFSKNRKRIKTDYQMAS